MGLKPGDIEMHSPNSKAPSGKDGAFAFVLAVAFAANGSVRPIAGGQS
jgi:hypothetical protein